MLSVHNANVIYSSYALLICYRFEARIPYFCHTTRAIFTRSPNDVCMNSPQKTDRNEKHLWAVLKNRIFDVEFGPRSTWTQLQAGVV